MIRGPPLPTASGYHYQVFFTADDIATYHEDNLELATGGETRRFITHREFLRDLLVLKLHQRHSDNLYSFRASRTLFQVYQFKPVLKFLQSPEQRILIADEVGLGKTIEAGIIYQELKARLDVRRVLVVCPSGLREKWYSELRSRFDEDFAILDSERLRRFLDNCRRYGGQEVLKGICSLELLRREEFTEALAELQIGFDLVIIDEAHHLRNAATLAFGLGEVLADQSEALVLLTATPLQMGNQDLFHLMQLVNPGEFSNFPDFEDRILPNQYVNAAYRAVARGDMGDARAQLRRFRQTPLGSRYESNPYYQQANALLSSLRLLGTNEQVELQRCLLELNTLARVFNRTRKRDVVGGAERRAFTVEVEFTPAERALYDAVIDFVRWQVGQAGYTGNVPIFTLIMRERQAASCIQALKRQVETALEQAAWTLHAEESNTDLRSDEEESDDLLIGLAQRTRVLELLSLCENLGATDTKFDRFQEALGHLLVNDPTMKVLVFSFFRPTLTYLYRRLTARGYRVEMIHGDVPLDERYEAIARFRDPASGIQVMLSSEVGAEGLDFEFCGAMFNYDLPWNPMRVEQRIGRLDRFGQTHDSILIYNLTIADTVESRILVRLYQRIGVFESSIGDLEVILGEEVRQLTREVFSRQLTPQEEERRASEALLRIERRRQLQEQFEKEKLSLLGQDAIFEQELETVREAGRFVSPEEVRSLVECFLEERFPRSSLRANRGDPTYVLEADEELIRHMAGFADQNRSDGPHVRLLLRRLQSGREIPVTFDQEVAQQRRNVEFVTVHHPLTLVAASHFSASSQAPRSEARIWAALPAGVQRGCDCAFFVFCFQLESLVPQWTLAPVLVEVATGDLRSDLGSGFLAQVQHRRDLPAPDVVCSESRFAELRDIAELHAADLRSEKEREAQRQNDALVIARLASLDRSYGFRIESARRQIESVTDERIIRMRRSQVANLLGRLKAKRREIESRRRVDVGFRLAAAGLVRFRPEGDLAEIARSAR